MDYFTILIFLAVAATIVAFGSGILSMVVDHEVAHTDSVHWMMWRVGLQGLAILLVILAIQKVS
jgi:hypothetical protein